MTKAAQMPPMEDLSWLKDFQRATVAYAFRRLYLDPSPASRFLVADEVGLGKTLVARGVVAHAIDYLQTRGRKRIDIVYICSNQAIARQNVQKLGPWARDSISSVDRITMLPARQRDAGTGGVNLFALTPGTSFSQGNQPGQFRERARLYALIERVWGREAVTSAGAKRVFYLGIADDHEAPRRLIKERAVYRDELDDQFVSEFQRELRRRDHERRRQREPSLQAVFQELSESFRNRRQSWPAALRQRRNAWIGELREALATTAITRLRPDLIILDEFQRFRDLLVSNDESSDDTWATRLARRLFNGTGRGSQPARTLLLSATPYPMYTLSDEASGEDHYAEFIDVCGFLLDDKQEVAQLQGDLDRLRAGLLNLEGDGGTAARAACDAVGARLRRVMARTERLGSSNDRNGMLTTIRAVEPELRPEDVRGYLAASAVAADLNQPDVIEYWKSAPYLLNFMEQYAFKRSIEDAQAEGRSLPALERAVRSGQGVLSWGDLQMYQAIEPRNVKLRAFIADLDRFGPWDLLWLPPSLPYYQTASRFDAPEARRFTKRLVFSSWTVVPKVIGSLVSYEAERRILGASGPSDPQYSTQMRERPGYLMNFRLDGDRPAAMTAFAFIYPSPRLAALGDALDIARELRGQSTSVTEERVLARARERIEAALRPHLDRSPQEGQPDQRWYWAAPLLLDDEADHEGLYDWYGRWDVSGDWTGTEVDSETKSGFDRHLEEAWEWLEGDHELGRPPGDLLDALAALAVGSPAICALRALHSVAGDDFEVTATPLRAGAARIAWAFRTLFSSPIETALVRRWSGGRLPFWHAALRYCVDGNLQAVLDEYAHALRDWLGFVHQAADEMIPEIARSAADAISLRTVNYRVDVPQAETGTVVIERESMRGRFAIRLSGGRSDEQDEVRVDHVRHAFNSPFWPFVLATTSVGQEGLDFHLYCHAVVHWNLPRNPVDLEQREGRIHRFKGHAIRKNVAAEYGAEVLPAGAGSLWDRLFEVAEERRAPDDGDLVPYWVFRPSETGAAIERHVPLLPLSREEGQLQALLRSVVAYRLAFGQPRQDDLVAWLGDHVGADGTNGALFDDLRVDLTPQVAS